MEYFAFPIALSFVEGCGQSLESEFLILCLFVLFVVKSSGRLSTADLVVQKLLPVAGDFVLQLAAVAARLGELVAPLVGARRVDDGARVEAFFTGRNARVEGAAPAAPENFDGVDGSERELIAQMTSSELVMSMSSSTTMT